MASAKTQRNSLATAAKAGGPRASNREKSGASGAPREFDATLQRTGDKLNWVVAHIPFDVKKIWGTRGLLRVAGEINGFGFSASLFPAGDGTHYLSVNKKMQAGGKVKAGESAHFRLQPDFTKPEVKIPAELARLLAQSKQSKKFFDALPYSYRRFMANWIAEAKA